MRFILLCFLFATISLHAQERFSIEGLEKPVEILVDQWGIPHIYAQTENDLFFAQGFYAARDRLFQFELWRRQATGTVAEILGPRELKRDIGTRLFRFRGDIEKEMNHYHPRGASIITSFVAGVNAYIEQTRQNPKLLTPEFELLGIQPQPWTPEVVISRHQGLLGNIGKELRTARAVAKIGPERVKELAWFHPKEPNLELDPKIDKDLLFEDILGLYNAFRRPVRFRPEDLVAEAQNSDSRDFLERFAKEEALWASLQEEEEYSIGSNNWIVSGEHTQSGYPMMANDPHRSIAVPSLRYMAHLVGPGWNVIGGGEPEIPGISIGHNEHGAWGLTVFRTDAEDLYVYKTNPDNPNQYWYEGHWEDMYIITDTIQVKKSQPEIVQLKYTRHGPVVFEDNGKNAACAVRCGWMEIGGSPYLASLRMDQSSTFEEFREACNYSNIPGENMIWADKNGNIGWQAVGIVPVRRNFSGMVPVPGDGSYEWDGYLPIIAKPKLYNPKDGIFVTANENVVPNDYEHWNTIGFDWSDPYRGDRVKEFLRSGRIFSAQDMAELQTDYLSIPARTLVGLLKGAGKSEQEKVEQAKAYLLDWDYRMEPNSIAAGIYQAWENRLRATMEYQLMPPAVSEYMSLQMKQVVDMLIFPDNTFGKKAVQGRNEFLLACLAAAVEDLEEKLGEDMRQWQYGQEDYKHVLIRHPMSSALNAEWRSKFNVGPYPRGGNSYTANVTGSGDNQTHGGTFRVIVDTGNWDHSLATNSPGQSGNVNHKHYRNLFSIWANDQFFPLFYSRKKIESVTDYIINLQPE
jgi:penicillin amidase